MRICLVLEGCYPYVHGGVSTWMHGYIQAMPEHEFVLWVIGAHAVDRGKFVYELPGNVVEVHEVFLDDALRLSGEQEEADFNAREREALRRLPERGRPEGRRTPCQRRHASACLGRQRAVTANYPEPCHQRHPLYSRRGQHPCGLPRRGRNGLCQRTGHRLRHRAGRPERCL